MNAIYFYRFERWFYVHKIPIFPKLIYYISYFLFNCSIPTSVIIGTRTRVGYGGMGIVLHGSAVIGNDCLISQQVTVGGRSKVFGVPTIGNYVYIGAGAKVLGAITIGDGSVIGANAVVVK